MVKGGAEIRSSHIPTDKKSQAAAVVWDLGCRIDDSSDAEEVITFGNMIKAIQDKHGITLQDIRDWTESL